MGYGDNVNLINVGVSKSDFNNLVESAKVEPSNYLYVGKNGNDTTGSGGANKPYLTVSKAITEATSGTTLFIFPGTYTEDITLKAGINMVAPAKFSVYIKGKVTVNMIGTVYAEKIIFKNDTDIVIDFKGTGAQNLQLLMCNVESSTGNNANAISYTNTNASSKISIADGVVTVYTSSGGAKAFSSVSTAYGTVLLDKTTCQILDNVDNICLDIAGHINFVHTQDQIKGQIVVSDSASTTFAILTMTTGTVPVFVTNSSGVSTLSDVVATTTHSPCFDGVGIFTYMALIYGNQLGVGGALTLSGGLGAIPLMMAPIRLRASGLTNNINDGTFEFNGDSLYFSIGGVRKTVTLI